MVVRLPIALSFNDASSVAIAITLVAVGHSINTRTRSLGEASHRYMYERISTFLVPLDRNQRLS